MKTLQGSVISQGYACGPAVVCTTSSQSVHPTSSFDQEQNRLNEAIQAYIAHTKSQAELIGQLMGKSEAEILTSHCTVIEDPIVQKRLQVRLQQGMSAERSLKSVGDSFIEEFQTSRNEELARRAHDVQDVIHGVLEQFKYRMPSIDVTRIAPGSILVVDELSPSMIARIKPEHAIAAILAEVGTPSSHAALLARALNIPVVASLEGLCSQVSDGMTVEVDNGTVRVIGHAKERSRARTLSDQAPSQSQGVQVYSEGLASKLVVALDTSQQITGLSSCDCAGVGLVRTELMFIEAQSMPTEESQYALYRKLARSVKQGPVVVRVFDIGGDKYPSFIDQSDRDQCAQTIRGIRFCLSHKELFTTQLRSLLRARTEGDIRVLLPFTTTLSELSETRTLIARCAEELRSEGIACDENIPVGVMIETPASVMMAREFAREADFLSVGTNDLTSTLMGVSRIDPCAQDLCTFYQPAVLRALDCVIRAAQDEQTPVFICGEASRDPLWIPLWTQWDITYLCVPLTDIESLRSDIALKEPLLRKGSGMRLTEVVRRARSVEDARSMIYAMNQETQQVNTEN